MTNSKSYLRLQKYGVTIYKEDNVDFGVDKTNHGDNSEDTILFRLSEKIAERIGWTIILRL